MLQIKKGLLSAHNLHAEDSPVLAASTRAAVSFVYLPLLTERSLYTVCS